MRGGFHRREPLCLGALARMDKVYARCAEAVADIPSGASLAVGGFGLNGNPAQPDPGAARTGRDRPGDGLEQLRRRRLGPGRAARQQAHPPDDRLVRRRKQGVRAPVSRAANSKSNWCRRARSPSGCAPAAAASRRSYTPAGVGTLVADGGLPWTLQRRRQRRDRLAARRRRARSTVATT